MRLHPGLIGLLAGVAAGLIVVAASRGGPLSMPLLFATPAAVYIASLGWGTLAGAMAAVIGAAIVAAANSPASAIVAAAVFLAPAAFAGHLFNLAQPEAQGLRWFPLPSLLARLMLALFAGFVLSGYVIAFNSAELAGELREALAEATDLGGLPQGGPAVTADAETVVALLPAVTPALALILHVLVMHLAAVVTARSGVLARPAEDIAANANLPPAAVAVTAAALGLTAMAQSPAYEIAAVAAGLGVGGLALVGLAHVHHASRGRAGRMPMLFATYALLVVFVLPAFVLAVMGAMRALRGGPASPPRSDGAARS